MANQIFINPENPEEEKIKIAAGVIRSNGVIIYPTDTVYGIGCDICSAEGVERIFRIKHRGEKPLSVAFSDLDMLRKFVVLPPEHEEFIKKHLDEPCTFIVKKTGKIPDAVTAGLDAVGVRIPDHRVVKELIKASGVPIITTSANISGRKAPKAVDEIDDEVRELVDLIVDSGVCRIGVPSRVIDLATHKVLRV